jgi:hypothetical protein
MPRVFLVFFFALAATFAAPPARPDEAIFEPFDAVPLAPSEKRLIQTALAATADYRGTLDGAWGRLSQSALEAYTAREFGGSALNAHAAALVLGFLDEVGESGWDFSYMPDLGISLALPLGRMGSPEPEEGGERRWTHDGSLTVLTHRFADGEVEAWHSAAARADTRPDALYTLRQHGLLATGGTLSDGRLFYTRSDRTSAGWATVYLASGTDQAGALNLIASSIRPGRPLSWELPAGGQLSTLVSEIAGFVDEARAGIALLPAGPSVEPRQAALPQADDPLTSTGTGFYLGARILVTAQHVIAGCNRITLAGGAELSVVASDEDLDVAALYAPDPAPRWLSLASGDLRLGQRVHAAGYPYYSIAGTSLNLTGGNVSALTGVDDDRRFFSFTAPVQPGNSGGPLIDAHGSVVGLVVARLSEDFILEATGSLPENVNYGLGESHLADFLRQNGVAAGEGGLANYDTDDGVPTGFDAAVVPIICEADELADFDTP